MVRTIEKLTALALAAITILFLSFTIALAPDAHADELTAGQSSGAISSYALLKSNGYLVPCSSSGIELSDRWSGSRETAAPDLVQTVFISPDISVLTQVHKTRYSEEYWGETEYSNDTFKAETSFHPLNYGRTGLPSISEVRFLPGSTCSTIVKEAFKDASNLGVIHLPNTMKRIEDKAFLNCTSLHDVQFGSSLNSIGSSAFQNCTSLTEIDLPSSLAILDTSNAGSNWGAFRGSGLRKVTLHSEIPVTDNGTGKSIWLAFRDTPIVQAGNGANIYVPTSALTKYRNHYGSDGSDGDGWSYFNQSHLDKLRGIDGEPESINDAVVTASQTSYVYNGKARTPGVTVTIGGKTLTKNVDYTVSYTNNVNAGTASITATGVGVYSGNASVTFRINPAAQPMKVTPKTAKVKKSTKTKKLSRSKVLAVSKAKGTVTYKKLSGNKKISVNVKNGNVTVKGGLAKKVYKVKVRVKAATKAPSNYKTGYKDVTFKVKVR